MFCSIYYTYVLQFEVPRDVIGDNGAATNSVDRVEENCSPEYGDEDGSTIHDVENDDDECGGGGDDDEEEEEEEEEENPGEVSIGKKILKFFTT